MSRCEYGCGTMRAGAPVCRDARVVTTHASARQLTTDDAPVRHDRVSVARRYEFGMRARCVRKLRARAKLDRARADRSLRARLRVGSSDHRRARAASPVTRVGCMIDVRACAARGCMRARARWWTGGAFALVRMPVCAYARDTATMRYAVDGRRARGG